MIINSSNEWDTLKAVVVGTASMANWPVNDLVYRDQAANSLWTESAAPRGPVPQWLIDQTNDDLDILSDVLRSFGVKVYRPNDMDFVKLDGMYNYCPRDRLLIAGQTVIDPAMLYPCRDQEIQALDFVCESAEKLISMPRNQGMILDAANVCRLDDTWLYLVSASGNYLAMEWLQQQLPHIRIEPCNFYSGVHIDSTIVPIRPGLVVLNASRVNQDNCPKVLKSWEKIWITEHDIVAQNFFQYPYASNWIGMNMLSINPNTVIVDRNQTTLIKKLSKHNVDIVPLSLRHSRTLGGGFHCVTLDLLRVR